jgi:hypothetical protein
VKRLLLCCLAALCICHGQDANRLVEQTEPLKVLWHAPPAGSVQDWKCAFVECDAAPVPPFQFVKEDNEGTTPKIAVRDARGRLFSVKFGGKVIPECFASRFVPALGYTVEPSYYVGPGSVVGVTRLHRARRFVKPDGSFARARFQLRDPAELDFLNDHAWSLIDSPFRGSREFAGLRAVLMLLSNWDIKDSRDGQEEANTGVFRSPDNGHSELLYSFFDWGSTLGRWGGLLRRTRSDCSGFAQDTRHFITGVRGDVVEWGYAGKRAQDVKAGITVEDLRWLAPYLERITDQEIRTGLKASGATDRQTACWADALEDRMRQVEAVARLGRH